MLNLMRLDLVIKLQSLFIKTSIQACKGGPYQNGVAVFFSALRQSLAEVVEGLLILCMSVVVQVSPANDKTYQRRGRHGSPTLCCMWSVPITPRKNRGKTCVPPIEA